MQKKLIPSAPGAFSKTGKKYLICLLVSGAILSFFSERGEANTILDRYQEAQESCDSDYSSNLTTWNDKNPKNLLNWKNLNSTDKNSEISMWQQDKPSRETISSCQERDRLEKRQEQFKAECDKLMERQRSDLEKQETKLKTSKEKIDAKEKEITNLEKKLTENRTKMQASLDELKKKTDQEIQKLKENKDKNLEGLDEKVKGLEERLAEYMQKSDEMTNKVANFQLKSQSYTNQLYIICFTQARQATEKEREKQQKMAREGKFQQKSLTDLTRTTRKGLHQHFKDRFNEHFKTCASSEEHVLKLKTKKEALKLQAKQMETLKIHLGRKQVRVQQEIQQMRSVKKVEALNKFKEKMQKLVANFNSDFKTKLKNFQTEQMQIQQEIHKLKQRQGEEMWTRSQNFSSPVRRNDHLCSNSLNLFNDTSSEDGLGFSDSTHYGTTQ